MMFISFVSKKMIIFDMNQINNVQIYAYVGQSIKSDNSINKINILKEMGRVLL